MEKVSVVVAVYNAEKTLKKCIDSLIYQSYQNIEIILVNDCSKDNSLSICNDYVKKNNKIRLINNKQNLGVSATRNKGIESSTGDFICFVDSDDYVETNYIECLYSLYKQHDLLPICGFVFHDEYNRKKPVDFTFGEKDEVVSLKKAFDLYDKIYLGALWNKLFDNFLIKKMNLRFDESLSMGEDLRFSLFYFWETNQIEVFVCNSALYHYTRLTNNSLMSATSLSDYKNGVENLKLISKITKRCGYDSPKVFLDHLISLRNNTICRIIRDNKYTKDEKLSMIREIKPDFTKEEYKKERRKIVKEKVKGILERLK